MIGVVADDFTGAAEIGAAGLRYGLNAEVQTVVNPDSEADLLVVDTDTRSRTPFEAASRVEKVLERLQEIPAEWIYKKVDSVMRGQVGAELRIMLTVLNRRRVILVPANPSQGRTISGGRYFIDDRPLNETDFSLDPEYPATSSDVLELLGPSECISACTLRHDEAIGADGIVVGEAKSKADILAWAVRLDEQSIAAGAADFFAGILEVKGHSVRSCEAWDKSLCCKTRLFVCGSSSHLSRKAIEEADSLGMPVSKMPAELLQTDYPGDRILSQWADEIAGAFERCSQVMVVIDQPITPNAMLAQRLRRHMAALVKSILGRISVDELCIEGGATASAVVRRLGWKRFFPCRELSPGVVRMRIEEEPNVCLTIKPGSYRWPEKIWRFT